MSRERQAPEPTAPKVPAYIVTFSDMVTLLLTFFVMLLTLAQVQDPKLFHLTRDAFITKINTFGLGILNSREIIPDLGDDKIKYHIGNPDKKSIGRTIDSKEEDIRRIYKKVVQSMTTMQSQMVAKKTDFSVTNINFAAGGSELNDEAKVFLKRFAVELQQKATEERFKLYVLGLAGGEATTKEQWLLSALRAQRVSNYIKSTLPEDVYCPVYSWGAGPGGEWVSGDSLVSDKSQILIAVLRDSD